MLFITRDVGITAHFCDRVAVIYAGEIMELAPRDASSSAAPPLHAHAAGRLLPQRPSCGAAGRARRHAGGDACRAGGCTYAVAAPVAQERCRVEHAAAGRGRRPATRPLPLSGERVP